MTNKKLIEFECDADVAVKGHDDGQEYKYDEKDKKALKALIAEQRAVGARVSANIKSSDYVWDSDGKLVGIYWNNQNLQGEISFADLPNLRTISCWGNQLTALDVSGNSALTALSCGDNPLVGTLDVRKNKALSELSCSNIQAEALLAGSTALQSLSCENNPNLKVLDISNTLLRGQVGLNGDDSLISVDISGAAFLESFVYNRH